jgi:hypothetical protein
LFTDHTWKFNSLGDSPPSCTSNVSMVLNEANLDKALEVVIEVVSVD